MCEARLATALWVLLCMRVTLGCILDHCIVLTQHSSTCMAAQHHRGQMGCCRGSRLRGATWRAGLQRQASVCRSACWLGILPLGSLLRTRSEPFWARGDILSCCGHWVHSTVHQSLVVQDVLHQTHAGVMHPSPYCHQVSRRVADRALLDRGTWCAAFVEHCLDQKGALWPP